MNKMYVSKRDILVFLTGTAIGVGAGIFINDWYLARRQKARIRFDDVTLTYFGKYEEDTSTDEETEEVSEPKDMTPQEKSEINRLKPDIITYAEELKKDGYVTYAEHFKQEEKPQTEAQESNEDEETEDDLNDILEETEGVEDMVKKPYVISPEEYEDYNTDYDDISLTYYADGILADDMDEIVEDPDNIVGPDFMNYFGKYEEDTVLIRNDRLKCTYEILRDRRTYEAVTGEKPYKG